MENAVELRKISKIYKLFEKPSDRLRESLLHQSRHIDFYALRDVDLDVPKGGCMGIVGVNGSGKSTLLKIITGVLTQSSGDLKVDGRISALLELGAGFNGEYNGTENIYLNGTVMGLSRKEIDERIDSILEFADIGEYIKQPVKTYSSGMFVRLAFSVAVHVDPDILIVDEALAVGDLYFQAKCYRKFNEFKEAGKTILFVSHSLDSILKYCNSAVLMHKGEIRQIGQPREVVDTYKQIMTKSDLLLDVETGSNSVEATKKADGDGAGNRWSADDKWHPVLHVNPELLEYGDKAAEISDFGLFNDEGKPCQCLMQGDDFEIRMKVKVERKIKDLIYAYTIKDLMGVEISGTNTMYEGIDLDENAGVYNITFKQCCRLAAGQYMISLGVTSEHGMVVHHRLYDLIAFEVISSKRCSGMLEPESIINIARL